MIDDKHTDETSTHKETYKAKHENKQNSDRGKQLKRKQRKHFPPSQQRQSTSQQPIMEQLGTHSVYTMFYLFIVERSGKS